uniref:Uncharacterized protein n=1 Tax=Caenorhabditis tropicalis TaxID=1561998 RepID=A0A1I7TDM7_9PELO
MPATPMPKSRFLIAAETLKDQIELEHQTLIPSPPQTCRKFIPPVTSTPSQRELTVSKKQGVLRAEPEHHNKPSPIEVIQLDTDDELHSDKELALLSSPPSNGHSPEPRPASLPMFSRLPSPIDPRPATADPVPDRDQARRPPPRKRIIAKLTIAHTPHCARPTKSWLSRLACLKRDDQQ